MSAIAISYAIGAPISGGIMSVFGGVAGLEDWQWLFLIEAIPALLAGVFVLFYLDDGPGAREAGCRRTRSAGWPSASRARRRRGMERERHTVGEAMKDRRVLAFGLLYFCMVVNVYGISFWVGEIVDQIGGLERRRQGLRDRDPVHRWRSSASC